MCRKALVVALLACACGSTTEGTRLSRDAGAESPTDAAIHEIDSGAPTIHAEDMADPLFDRDHLVSIEIELAPHDWDALRSQTRTLESTLARAECLAAPFESPFTYFKAQVRIDGERFEHVGVRKKGFLGSLSETRPSLKIKLDEYLPGLEFLGLSSLTLNNGQQDPTLIKPCLGYDVFRRAGLPAPRCNYAEVIVNGESLGPYVNLQTVNKPFLRSHFVEDEGQLYEGTLSDFRDEWLGTFEQKTNEDTPYDRADLEGLTRALDAPDARLFESLEPWVDLDQFYRFWVVESLIAHWDGYAGNTNNFFVYRHPVNGKFRFIPWGADGIFDSRDVAPTSVLAEGYLARRLYLHPQGRQRYVATFESILDEIWDADQMRAEIDRAARVIAPAVPAAAIQPLHDATERLRGFVTARERQLRAELDLGGAEWTNPARDPLCFDFASLSAHIQTRFGTHPAPDIFRTGTGTFTATVGAQRIEGLIVGSSAGIGVEPNDLGRVVLLQASTTADGSIPVVYVVMDPQKLASGLVPIDGESVAGALLRIPRPGAELEVVGFFWQGWIEIRTGSATPDAPIDVSVHAQLLSQRR
ncbi:MAG: CotH kinase family protein [Deltaproteobacteria bacterium]|nr:CotH kinase family protein [Deltaproteobacteria bacterium]